MPDVIDPPDTLEIRLTVFRTPLSYRRQMTPT